jgi:amino acid transporter
MNLEEQSSGALRLRKELGIWAAIGISLALMAPSMAANISPQGSAVYVGRAVPLTFLIATVGVLFIAYTFVRLSQHFNHAGSVYGFVGVTLGPRVGVAAGWSLVGTYIFYSVLSAMAGGIFGASELSSLGLWHNPPSWAGFLVGGILLVGVIWLSLAPARRSTHVLMSVEGATVSLILITATVVLIRLLGHTAPNHASFTLSVFTLPHGTSQSGLFLGVVFGFLSFAGFEAAATLGEECRHPRRDIPRAILGVAIFGGLFFVFVTACEVMGFGTSASGMKAFAASGSLLGDLGSKFIGSWMGDVITLGTVVSAFGCALASAVGAARIVYALGRDAVLPQGLGRVSLRRGIPGRATWTVVIAVYVSIFLSATAFHASPFETWAWFGTMGTLILLVVYAVATVGAMRLLFFSAVRTVRRWEIVIPIVALVVIGYTLYRNVVPYPTGSGAWLPAISGIWILLGVVYIVVRPRVARRAGERLTTEEGLAPASADSPVVSTPVTETGDVSSRA